MESLSYFAQTKFLYSLYKMNKEYLFDIFKTSVPNDCNDLIILNPYALNVIMELDNVINYHTKLKIKGDIINITLQHSRFYKKSNTYTLFGLTDDNGYFSFSFKIYGNENYVPEDNTISHIITPLNSHFNNFITIHKIIWFSFVKMKNKNYQISSYDNIIAKIKAV